MSDFFDDFSDDRRKKDIVAQISSLPSNYVGSKRRMLNHIIDVLDKHEIQYDSVFDAFSGSATVSLLFKLLGKKVFCNDILTSSSITAVCLLENTSVPLTESDLKYLCTNDPKNHGSFVFDNYKDKFFTEKECLFLDKYKANVEELCGEKFYCGLDLISKATLNSIPNSNFSVKNKNLIDARSSHTLGKSFWEEKWRDTTRKRRDKNNEIMFEKAINEMNDKYKGAFSLFAIENHINQCCFLGGRYYNGQTVAKLEHRLKHKKNDNKDITDIPISLKKFKSVFDGTNSDCFVFNSDIVDLLESNVIEADLLYLDPPYGGAASDYANLYRFLEEYVYEAQLEELEHIQRGAKRFSKKKGYPEQFEHLLSLCGSYKTWLISYNESSFADINTIVQMIKDNGKKDVIVEGIPFTYQYRKGKNIVEFDHEKYADSGHTYQQRGTEYLILAQ